LLDLETPAFFTLRDIYSYTIYTDCTLLGGFLGYVGGIFLIVGVRLFCRKKTWRFNFRS